MAICNIGKKVKVSHTVVSDSLWSPGLCVARQAPLSMEFSRQEYWCNMYLLILKKKKNMKNTEELLRSNWEHCLMLT